jgi:putative tricarboxylic transport membrane protein
VTTVRWKDANFIAGLILACLSIYIIYTANHWTKFNSEGPGPGFFPFGYGLLMLGLSVALIYQRLTASAAAPAATHAADRAGRTAAFLSWAGIIASIPLMWLLGFVIGFGLFVVFMVRVVFGRSWRTSVITAAAISGSLYLVFPVLLGAALPVGRFWGF